MLGGLTMETMPMGIITVENVTGSIRTSAVAMNVTTSHTVPGRGKKIQITEGTEIETKMTSGSKTKTDIERRGAVCAVGTERGTGRGTGTENQRRTGEGQGTAIKSVTGMLQNHLDQNASGGGLMMLMMRMNASAKPVVTRTTAQAAVGRRKQGGGWRMVR
jgi:hypothetical protein